MDKNYPEYAKHLSHLSKGLSKEIPDTMAAFRQLHKAATADGVLSKQVKELIALGIAIGARCDGCIAHHVGGSLRAGASKEAIAETIGVAILMGGGPASVYGSEALAALEQFTEAQA